MKKEYAEREHKRETHIITRLVPTVDLLSMTNIAPGYRHWRKAKKDLERSSQLWSVDMYAIAANGLAATCRVKCVSRQSNNSKPVRGQMNISSFVRGKAYRIQLFGSGEEP